MIAYLIDPAELTEEEVHIDRVRETLLTPVTRSGALTFDPEPIASTMETVEWRLYALWGDSAIYLRAQP